MGAEVIQKITPVLLVGCDEAELLSLMGNVQPRSLYKFLSRKSLFQQSVLQSLCLSAPVIVCEERYVSLVQEQLCEIGVNPRAVLSVPEDRGAAASIAMAAFHLKNLNEVMFVVRADQPFSDDDEYNDVSEAMCSYVDDGIAIFGGGSAGNGHCYGLIDYVPDAVEGDIYRVKNLRFDLALKEADGACSTYAGCFMARPRIYLEALKNKQCHIYKNVERSYYSAKERCGVMFASTEEFLRIGGAFAECDVIGDMQNLYVHLLQGRWGVQPWPKAVTRSVASVLKKA